MPHMHSCSGARMVEFSNEPSTVSGARQNSQLRQWPVQLTLVSPNAPYFNDADLVIAADCVPFAFANFHSDLLKGKALAIGCPKLDAVQTYSEKLAELIKASNVKSITVAILEIPCRHGLYAAVETAVNASGKSVKLEKKVISIQRELQ